MRRFPNRYITVPSYFEYILQICKSRTRRLSLLLHHPRLNHRAVHAAHYHHLLGTNLWVQMTTPLRTRGEGRLTILQRASTRTLSSGQTTLIPTTTHPPRPSNLRCAGQLLPSETRPPAQGRHHQTLPHGRAASSVCRSARPGPLAAASILGVEREYKGLYGGGWPLRGMGAAGTALGAADARTNEHYEIGTILTQTKSQGGHTVYSRERERERESQVWCGRENSSAVHGGNRCESTGVCRRGFVSRILSLCPSRWSDCVSPSHQSIGVRSLRTYPRVNCKDSKYNSTRLYYFSHPKASTTSRLRAQLQNRAFLG